MAIAIKKTAAIAIAAGLTFAGSAGIAAQDALAQTTSTRATAAQAPAADLIGDDPAKLTIHKYENPSELHPGNGEEDENVKGNALSGVGFTAYKIDGDITNQTVFNEIATLANERNIKGARDRGLGPAIDLGKTADGSLTKELPVGAYLIEETTPPVSDTATYVKADPFIVFLPMTASDGKSWNRDVHVYPKNSMARITKAVVDDKVNAEDENRPNDQKVVTYTLDGIVPATPENRTLSAFNINDSYNNAELRLDEGFVNKVEVVRGTTRTELTAGTDYTVTSANETAGKNVAEASSSGQAYNAGFTISLTEAGLGKVQVNDHVVATVEATLLNANTRDGQDIYNDVNLTGTFERTPGSFTDTEETPGTWETPHDEVVTYLGNIEVYKTDDAKKPLAGATFDLYRCGAKDNVLQTGISDASGVINFQGLHVTNWRNNEPAPENEVFDYCVVETKAPDGYSKDTAEKKITLTKEDRKVRNAEGVYNQVADTDTAALRMNGVTVANIKSTTPTLPATGGMGVLIIALAGLAIIGGGVYAARRNSQSA